MSTFELNSDPWPRVAFKFVNPYSLPEKAQIHFLTR